MIKLFMEFQDIFARPKQILTDSISRSDMFREAW